jgi:SAM-dependent methyltransferase
MANDFYKWFSERKLTKFGGARRLRIERSRLAVLAQHAAPGGDLIEVGPGVGSLVDPIRAMGWRYRAIEASPTLAASLRDRGVEVTEAWVPPFPVPDACCDVLYADQVLEHMSGIDGARAFVSEALRVLRPGGVVFIVVPDYLKEKTFFWDVDYTHNFVTTERRVRHLLGDHGFTVERVVRSIGASTGVARDLLAGLSMFANLPGLEPLSRYTKTEDVLFRIRKNFFETLTFVGRKPGGGV